MDVFAGCKVSGACSDGGALTLAAADVTLSAAGRGRDLRLLCSSIVGSKSVVVC